MKPRIPSGLAAVAALMTRAVSTLAQQQQSKPFRYGYGPQMMGWSGGWYGMILGPIFMILVLAIVIALVVLLVRWLGGPRQDSQPPTRHRPGRPARHPQGAVRTR